MGWHYEPIIRRIREKAEREGNTEILQLSEEEHEEIIRAIWQDFLIIQDEKAQEAEKRRCEHLAESVKNMIDGFFDSEWDSRAVDFLLSYCDRCLVTFAVEFDMPLHFYIEMVEIGESKVIIDSLINAVVAEYDADVLLELPLDEVFMEELSDEVFDRAKALREYGNLNVVERYKNVEYTADIANG